MIDLIEWGSGVIDTARKRSRKGYKAVRRGIEVAKHGIESGKELLYEKVEETKEKIDESPRIQEHIRTYVGGARSVLQKGEEAVHRQDTVLIDFPRAFQPNRYSCGAESTFVILKYFKKARSVAQVTKELHTTRDGTGIGPMLSMFRRRGLKVRRIKTKRLSSIKKAIDADSPVLVCLDIGPAGHWAVIYGYSSKSRHVWLSDPSLKSGSCRKNWEWLAEKWDGTGIVVEG